MKVLLLQPRFPEPYDKLWNSFGTKNPIALMPPLGLLVVAAMLPKDWDLIFIDLMIQDITERDWDEVEIVFITGMAVQDTQVIEAIRDAKKRGKIVVVGGPWVFHFPQIAIDNGADLVVRGELEPVIDELMNRIHNKEFGGIIEAEKRADMTGAYLPRYDLVEMDRYFNMGVQISRGCPHECDFCDVTNMLGRRFRSKENHQVLEELQMLYDLGWRGWIYVVDDNFIGIVPRTKALLREFIPWMEERKHPFEFHTFASVKLADDKELMDLMVRAGFVKVWVGIETTDINALSSASKHHNVAADLDRACREINQAGLMILATFIIGFDNETPNVDKRLIDFINRNDIPEAILHPLRAMPGTKLWKRLDREGRLLHNRAGSLGNNSGLLNFRPLRPERQIVEETIRFTNAICEPGGFMKRAFGHLCRLEYSSVKKSYTRIVLKELRFMFSVFFWRGVLSSQRWTFWNLLLRMLLKCPDKIRYFLIYGGIAELFCQYGKHVPRLLLARLEEVEHVPLTHLTLDQSTELQS